MSKFSADRGSPPPPSSPNVGKKWSIISYKKLTKGTHIYFMKQIKKLFNRLSFKSYLPNPNAIRK